MKRIFFKLTLFIAIPFLNLAAETTQKYGEGFLECIDGQSILHLQGSPYEIGFQHGILLQDQIAHNITRFIDHKIHASSHSSVIQNFLSAIPQITNHLPAKLIEEMQGLADGAKIPYEKILLLNLFPEMFHCSAITVQGKASLDERLYHVRVLDYSTAMGLQDTAVLAVVKPEKGHTFINVTYAGFIGSVTGMNEQKIALGEIGGKGYGSWNGLPMAFLLRQILEEASSIEDIKHILMSTPRTCEYYYIFSDGKDRSSLAVYATAQDLKFVQPGSTYALPFCAEEKQLTSFTQPDDCIVMTRGDHFKTLIERLMTSYGHISPIELFEAIKQPVAHNANLHNALFAPETLELWLAHAGPNNEPACTQVYQHYDWLQLTQRP